MAISAQSLIKKFQYAYNHKWGYIWGTHGRKWTVAAQRNLNKSKDSRYAASKLYGKQWIGHWVADCSGLFVWAFLQFGYKLPHGCRYIWSDCCTRKGKLSGARKLKPGTAVFTYNKKHMGLYIGNGKIIGSAGSYYGVIQSSILEKKWIYWAELKKVNYGKLKT